jgi:hypothetical protein
MELYVTKKVDNAEDFSLSPLDTLPHMHIITPLVIIKRDPNGNFYISDVPSETNTNNSVSHLIKIKKLICKQGFKKEPEDPEKYKLSDDVVWVKGSPIMYYKCENTLVPCNRLILNQPIQLQISCKSTNIYSVPKPYNIYNMFFTIDYVMVDKTFKWELLAD